MDLYRLWQFKSSYNFAHGTTLHCCHSTLSHILSFWYVQFSCWKNNSSCSVRHKLIAFMHQSLNVRSDAVQFSFILKETRKRGNCAALQPPVSLMSARRGLSLLAIALLLLLAHDSWTVYMLMSSLPHQSTFARNWKHLFRQSYPDIVLSCVAMVVLEVTFS